MVWKVSQLKETQNKILETNMNKYGVKNYAQTEECKEKIKETCLLKYGVENPMQNNDIQEKQKQTCFDKYGVENVFESKDFQEKTNNIMLSKYGVLRMMQDENHKQEILIKSMNSRYKNGNVVCSSQQKYLHNILGEELNYPVNNFFLDIAFPEEMIYI